MDSIQMLSEITSTEKHKLFLLALISIVLSLAISSSSHAINSPQTPATESAIIIESDGLPVFDATTFDLAAGTNAGMDASYSNGIVRNFDMVTYNIETALNDADDTNLLVTATLNSKASWTNVPAECKSVDEFPSLSPDSARLDTNSDGLYDTLICNFGDKNQGTKMLIKPVAMAVGDNTNIIAASVVSSSDNNTNSGPTIGSGPVETMITASFGISLNKSVASLAEADEIDYSPAYVPSGVLDNINNPSYVSPEGKIVNFHVNLAYNSGSEFIAEDPSNPGTQSFTILDTWVGTHSNDPTVEGDNANGDYDDEIVLKGDITGDPDDSCSLLGQPASSSATVTCTQAGPGEPITIQINEALINQASLAKISMNFFYPYDHIFRSNGISTSETYNIDNTVTLVDWGNDTDPSDGQIDPITPIESITGTIDAGPEVGVEDYLVNAGRSGGFAVKKTFDNLNSGKSGKRAGAPGEIIETSLMIYDYRKHDTYPAVCDTIDTGTFEFAGIDPESQIDAQYHGRPIDTQFGQIPVHRFYNPYIVAELSTNRAETKTMLDGAEYGTSVEYSTISYSATGDDHWTATCEDDLDNNGSYDWVSDYNILPGGASDVIRVRLSWDRVFDDIVDAGISPNTVPSHINAMFSFNLRIKNTNIPGDVIPNTATSTLGAYGRDGSLKTHWQHDTVITDENNALFSFTANRSDRVHVLGATMGINKVNNPSDQAPVSTGEEVTFTIDPQTNGSNASAVTMTFTDKLPAGLEYISDTCESAYLTASPSLTCITSFSGNVITFTVIGYQIGNDLPVFDLTSRVLPGISAGTKTNKITISSDFATLSDTSHCDDSVSYLGVADQAAIDRCVSGFSKTHTAYATVQVLAENGAFIKKSIDLSLTEPNSNFTTTLSYANYGGSSVGQGQIIDVLPHNGDGQEGTLRYNNYSGLEGTTDGTSTSASPVSPSTVSDVSFESITASAAGETFEYTTSPYAQIDHRPCHPSNWPVTDSLDSATNTGLSTICSLGLIDPATDVPTPSQPGTGTTDWTTAVPTDNATKAAITAIRISTPAYAAGQPQRDIDLTMNTLDASEGDIMCNNFGYNATIITLDIISNDVCTRVASGAISGNIWTDLNNNATTTNTDTEPFIQGLTVELLDENGDPVPNPSDPTGTIFITTTTDSAGYYEFTNLPSGTYQTRIEAPATNANNQTLLASLLQTYDSDDGSNTQDFSSPTILATPLLSGPITIYGPLTPDTATTNPDTNDPYAPEDYLDVEDQSEINYSFAPEPASLGDYLWVDENVDGVQDPSEFPIENATVNLVDPNNNNAIIATTTTDSSGLYQFTGLIPGDYAVTVDTSTLETYIDHLGNEQPPINTYDLDDGTSNPNSASGTVTLVAGGNNPDLDFGYYAPASIGSYIWNDTNKDGVQDSSEIGIEGIVVTLLNQSGNPIETATTDENGLYYFTELLPGNYAVTYAVPADLEYTYNPDTGTDTPDNTSGTITLLPGMSNTDQDFGLYAPASIGDTVYIDADVNGVQGIDEMGIEGVTVNLLDSSGNIIQTMQTLPNGSYYFTNLTPETYTVSIDTSTLPRGLIQTIDYDSDLNQNNRDSDNPLDNRSTYDLSGGEISLSHDFGYIMSASLSGNVWNESDTSKEGSTNDIDDGDVNLKGVRVDLVDEDGDVIKTTTTDKNGHYEFTDLTPGIYSIVITPPEDLKPFFDIDGSDTSLTIEGFVLSAGQSLTHQDFSLVPAEDGLAETGQSNIFILPLIALTIVGISAGAFVITRESTVE